MAYTPTTWVNNSSPDIDATNLNKMETGIDQAHMLATPIDTTSIISAHDGEGVPEIPDDVAGVTTLQNEWATLDGWTVNPQSTPTPTYPGGVLKITAGASGAYILIQKALSFTGKAFIVRMRSSIASEFRLIYTIGTDVTIVTKSSAANTWQVLNAYNAGAVTIAKVQSVATYSANDTVEIDFIYIGTGAYSSRVYDKSGNGMHMINNAAVPVPGKYGRDLFFNGSSTSYLRSPDYFTMPDIFNFRCTWDGIENLTTNQAVFGQQTTIHPSAFRPPTSTNLYVRYWDGSAGQLLIFSSFFTATYHKISITINRTAGTVSVYKDGVLFETRTGLTIALNTTAEYLYYGRRSDGLYLKGSLGNIRTDSRAFTADEELAWANDPTCFDAQEKSVTASPYSIATRNMNGGLSTRTALSDPKHATPASRPAGFLYEVVGYGGKLYFCTNATTPTWEMITSA